MKKLYMVILALVMALPLVGQTIDQTKMDKDLEVAKNVLATVMEKNSPNRFFYRNSDNITAKYVEDYGVTFTVQSRFTAFFDRALGGTVSSGEGNAPVVIGRSRVKDDNDKASEIVVADAPATLTIGNLKGNEENLKESFVDFLKNYSTLIRQLKANDKIMIKTTSRNRGIGAYVLAAGRKLKSVSSISVEAQKRDLDDYATGKLSDKELEVKLVIRESSSDIEKEPEIEVFSSILNRLYQSDMSDTYYVGSSPWYERTEGLGLTYYLKFYSSMEGDGFFYLPTIEKDKVEAEERDRIVNDMYPKFLEGFKENILEYGHLLKNLRSDESLIFNLDLTKCEDCEMPQEIEVTLKKSLIDQYRDSVITLNQAKGEVKVKVIR